jgi:1-acyl-sn-glycerol-3-phosphate acyltransferase
MGGAVDRLIRGLVARRAGRATDGAPRFDRSPARILSRLARLLLAAFYREVAVVGRERLPRSRPLVIVANHVNGLVDPLLILGTLPVRARFLAKSTLWKIPVLGRLLTLGGAIPVYRRQDVGEEAKLSGAEAVAEKNRETFARCRAVLAAGGAVALFPEGTSHNLPALQPLKTGAARIALEAEAERRQAAAPGEAVQIVPVGLLFDVRPRFRSRAFVQVGEPIDLAAEPVGAVRELTARIDAGLRVVTLNYTSWDEARLIARAADLVGRPELELPRRRSLAEGIELRRALLAGYREIAARRPERVATAAEAVRRYDRLLRALGLRDDQVAAAYPPFGVARFVAQSLLRLLVHLPLAVVGTALNLLPYLIVRIIARQVRHAPDQGATWKVFSSLVVYPVGWALAGIAVTRWTGSAWLGVLAALAAPWAGWAGLRFHETRLRFGREAWAYLVLRTRGHAAADVRRMRDEVYREVEDLIAEWES